MDKSKFKIVSNINDEELCSIFNDDTFVYVKPSIYTMSDRKLESLINIAKIQKYYQCNPVKFIEDFFNITLLDTQAYIVMRSWNCPICMTFMVRC